jgi:hypothetical protein
MHNKSLSVMRFLIDWLWWSGMRGGAWQSRQKYGWLTDYSITRKRTKNKNVTTLTNDKIKWRLL